MSSLYCTPCVPSFHFFTHSQVMVANAKVEWQEKKSYVIILKVVSA